MNKYENGFALLTLRKKVNICNCLKYSCDDSYHISKSKRDDLRHLAKIPL